MIMRQKPARPRSGNVAIEAALVFSLCAVLLAGMVEVGQALRNWYQLLVLTDHVGQMVARADAPSGAFIQDILRNTRTLPVVERDGAVLRVSMATLASGPGGGGSVLSYEGQKTGGCTPHDPAAALSALSGMAGSFVVVQACLPTQGGRIPGGGVLPTLYGGAVFALGGRP